MKVGVIAELNPFHYGHEKLFTSIRENYPNCTIIMVLGGNFQQRGIPSVINKWKKTEIALEHGVDLVVELPFAFATQSADTFANGAIALLKALQIDVLAFGTETNDLEGLKAFVDAQDNEMFDSLVQVFLRMGKNYPTALSLSLEELTGKKFALPNDLLAISYLKAIKKQQATFSLFTVKRENNYHLEDIQVSNQSASSIRSALKEGVSLDKQVPNDVKKALLEGFVLQDDYFPYLRYKILVSEDLSIYLGVDDGLHKKLKQAILEVENYQELIEKLHTKNHTYNYISRMLLHILIGFTKEDAKKYEKHSYIRLLGFSKKGQKHLNAIKKDCPLPIFSKFSKEMQTLLHLDSKATQIYALAYPEKMRKQIIKQEFGQAPIKRKDDEND